MLNTLSITVTHDRNKRSTKRFTTNPRKGLIQLCITLNGKRRILTTGISVYKDQFTAGRIVQHEQAEELQGRIDAQIAAITGMVNDCDRKGRKATFQMIDALYYRHAGASDTWIKWMEDDIKSRDIAEGTRKYHVKVLRFLTEQGVTDKTQLTLDTIQELDDVLHRRTVAGKKLDQPTIYDYHKVIRSYIHRAIRAGVLEFDPYTMFQVQKGRNKEREVLTMEELKAVQGLETMNKYIQHVRDLFLMQCYTGISVGDMMTMDFRKAVQGDVIKGIRGKTGVPFTTVLLPQAKAILNRYKNRLPVMAYDDYRRMIQPMLQAAGVAKKVSTHNARHTFATTVALANGVPMETVSKMLGHTSVKTTQIYAKVLDRSVEIQAAKLGAVLNL